MSREPLTLKALGGMAVAAALELVMVFGVDVPDGLREALVGVIAVGGVIYAVVTGRMKVTPVDDPRSGDGTKLVPEGSQAAATPADPGGKAP